MTVSLSFFPASEEYTASMPGDFDIVANAQPRVQTGFADVHFDRRITDQEFRMMACFSPEMLLSFITGDKLSTGDRVRAILATEHLTVSSFSAFEQPLINATKDSSRSVREAAVISLSHHSLGANVLARLHEVAKSDPDAVCRTVAAEILEDIE